MLIKEIISKMTLEEKAKLLSGRDFWSTMEYPEYGVPSMFLADGPHGIRKQVASADHLGLNESLKATCFPTAAFMANSWNTELAEIIGIALGTEAIHQKVNVVLGPGINMKRNPRCGRNFEYYSEDPFLAGKLAAAYVRGIQSMGVSACVKHFAVNNQEDRRMVMDAIVDERTLREIYLTAFEMVVKDGKTNAIMSSYNRLNGEYANENKHLLCDILRKEWGFKGVTVTDWGGCNDRVKGLKCGNELEMPTTGGETTLDIIAAVKDGVLDEKVIDENIERLLTLVFDTNKVMDKKTGFDVEKHHNIAENAARSGIVLLKNKDNILPIKKGKKVAVIGDFAKNSRYQGAGSSVVNPTKLDNAFDNLDKYDFETVGYEQGFKRYGQKSKKLLKRALKLAGKAEMVLLYIGLDENTETEGLDRKSIKLPENQLELIRELSKTNTKIVAVLSCGSVIDMSWADSVDAIVFAGLGGQAIPIAVIDVLTGKVNPGGKLSESYPYDYNDCPSADNFPGGDTTVEYREGIYVGYRYYDTNNIPVRYEFGFGLSYTTFEYSDLKITDKGVSFNIKNTGDVYGEEIAQLYIGTENSKIFRPKKELKGFDRISLQPKETKTVEINFDDYSFRYFNTKTNEWEIEGCTYKIMIGASISDIRLEGKIEKQGTTEVLPYDEKVLPSYFSADIAHVSEDEFSKLYGKELPDSKYKFIKKNRLVVDCNTTVQALRYSKGWSGRFFAGALRFADKFLRFIGKTKTAIMLNLGFFNMPIRGLCRMSGGMISWKQLQGLIVMFNGKFFKGLHIFLKEGRIRKKRIKAEKKLTKGNN